NEIWGAFSCTQQDIIRAYGSLSHPDAIREMRAYSTLREDVWKRIDERVLFIAKERLNGILDLENRGLVQPLGDMGVQVSQWERASDFEVARQVMRPTSQGSWQRVEFDSQFVPVPVT